MCEVQYTDCEGFWSSPFLCQTVAVKSLDISSTVGPIYSTSGHCRSTDGPLYMFRSRQAVFSDQKSSHGPTEVALRQLMAGDIRCFELTHVEVIGSP